MSGRRLAAVLAITGGLVLAPGLAAQHVGHGTPPPAAEPPAAPMDHSQMNHGQMNHDQMNHGQANEDPAHQPAEPAPAGPAVTLAELEAKALAHHPALRAAEAGRRAGEGEADQAGRWPNPTFGLAADDVPLEAGRDDVARYGFFVEQRLATGGKLGKARAHAEARLAALDAAAARDRLALLTEIRVLAVRAAAAKRRSDALRQLDQLGQEALAVSQQLFNTGAADQSDLLAARIETRTLGFDARRADRERAALLVELAATVGEPGLVIAEVSDPFAPLPVPLVREEIWKSAVDGSPELALAAAEVAVAEAALARAKAEARPDVDLRAGALDSQERMGPGGPRVGWEGSLEIGVELPLFDRNQGGILAATAEVERARAASEVVRGRLAARFEATWVEYESERERASELENGLLTDARAAYAMLKSRYEQMMAAYPQVLIAQRTLHQLEVEHAEALERMGIAEARLRGLATTESAAP